FLNSTTKRRNSSHLINVVKGNNESLRDYLTRFNKESLKVKNLEPSFALEVLKNGLKYNSPFNFSIMKKPTQDMADLLRLAENCGDSSDDILYKHAFDQLRIPADQLRPVKTPLVGFVREMVHPLGSIDLSVVADTAPRQTQVMTFLVVDTPSPYNAIVGTGLNLMEAIVSTRHLAIKFLTRFGMGEVRGDQQIARQCYRTAIMDKGKETVIPITNVELRGEVEPERPQPVENVVHVPLEEGNAEKVFQVGSQLGEVEK
ncbi:LOW QUALITY PROTEIN: hypothetical protein CFOL_v3_01280, partial [Cephalotus follicularis]